MKSSLIVCDLERHRGQADLLFASFPWIRWSGPWTWSCTAASLFEVLYRCVQARKWPHQDSYLDIIRRGLGPLSKGSNDPYRMMGLYSSLFHSWIDHSLCYIGTAMGSRFHLWLLEYITMSKVSLYLHCLGLAAKRGPLVWNAALACYVLWGLTERARSFLRKAEPASELIPPLYLCISVYITARLALRPPPINRSIEMLLDRFAFSLSYSGKSFRSPWRLPDC